MIYAQIKDSIVINCIVLDDENLIPLFSAGYDYFIRIDELDPRPGPGYSYDGNIFIPPVLDPAPNPCEDC